MTTETKKVIVTEMVPVEYTKTKVIHTLDEPHVGGPAISGDPRPRNPEEIAYKLAVDLLNGFSWTSTLEGDLFWHDVYKRLKRLAGNTKPPLHD